MKRFYIACSIVFGEPVPYMARDTLEEAEDDADRFAACRIMTIDIEKDDVVAVAIISERRFANEP